MNFDKAVELVLAHEGGYSVTKGDLGGETNFGIAKASHPNVDIKNLTKDGAKVIYKKEYWDACHCDGLAEDLRYLHFDTAVNMGAGRAAQFLKDADTLEKYATIREAYYHKIVANNPSQQKFLQGWLNRLHDVVKQSKNA